MHFVAIIDFCIVLEKRCQKLEQVFLQDDWFRKIVPLTMLITRLASEDESREFCVDLANKPLTYGEALLFVESGDNVLFCALKVCFPFGLWDAPNFVIVHNPRILSAAG